MREKILIGSALAIAGVGLFIFGKSLFEKEIEKMSNTNTGFKKEIKETLNKHDKAVIKDFTKGMSEEELLIVTDSIPFDILLMSLNARLTEADTLRKTIKGIAADC